MKKKHVIYVLVDALSYDNVGAREFRCSPTPFLDELKEKSISYENLYTQAPYTEAAFISNVCGENTLDHGGYMMGMSQCEQFHHSLFKENGYITMSTYSPYVYSKSYIKDVDHIYYSRVFSIQPLLIYRLSYFNERYHTGELTEIEKELCVEILGETFETWLQQLDALLQNHESVCMIEDLVNEPECINEVRQQVEEEFRCFQNEPSLYIESFFRLGEKHTLYHIKKLSIENKQTRSCRDYIEQEFGSLVSEFQNVQNIFLKKNLKVDIGYLLDLMRNDEQKLQGALRTYRAYQQRKDNQELIEALGCDVVKEKVTISAHRQCYTFANKIKELVNEQKPIYAFLHIEDFHLPSMFYSYDIENQNVLKEEFSNAKEYVSSLPEQYRGNLLADLSARYVDSKLRMLFNELQSTLGDDMLFIVSADHGYPSNGNPPRPILYNSFYEENYHIPFIAYGADLPSQSFTEYHSSLDILPTILTLAGLSLPKGFSKMILDKGRPYVLVEYPGPGCPDISKKEIYYAIFSDKYEVACKVKLNDDITSKHIIVAFDRKLDKEQKKNLRRQCSKNTELSNLISHIQERHLVLRKQFFDHNNSEKFYYDLKKGITI